jgi:hypothetical protein
MFSGYSVGLFVQVIRLKESKQCALLTAIAGRDH